MMAIMVLGAMILGLLYMLLFNWKALGAFIAGLFGIALTFVVGFGGLYFIFEFLKSTAS